MPYRIKSDESVPDGIRRIVCEQIDCAIAELAGLKTARGGAIHSVRKRFKKIRGVIRLVRGELDGCYRRENSWYRDLGQGLSVFRDAQVMVDTLDQLIKDCGGENDFRPIRSALVRRRRKIASRQPAPSSLIRQTVADLRIAKKRVAAWPLRQDQFTTVASGLKETYCRGRKACSHACADLTAASFHEWRKAVTYHWCHIRLLECIWPDGMDRYRCSLKSLAALLGEYHDLAVLRQTLLQDSETFGILGTWDLVQRIKENQKQLRIKAQPLGQRIYAEKPGKFMRRVHRYWKVWRR